MDQTGQEINRVEDENLVFDTVNTVSETPTLDRTTVGVATVPSGDSNTTVMHQVNDNASVVTSNVTIPSDSNTTVMHQVNDNASVVTSNVTIPSDSNTTVMHHVDDNVSVVTSNVTIPTDSNTTAMHQVNDNITVVTSNVDAPEGTIKTPLPSGDTSTTVMQHVDDNVSVVTSGLSITEKPDESIKNTFYMSDGNNSTFINGIKVEEQTSHTTAMHSINDNVSVVTSNVDTSDQVLTAKQKSDQGKIEVLRANVEQGTGAYYDAQKGLDEVRDKLNDSTLSIKERDELYSKESQYQTTINNYENSKDVLDRNTSVVESGLPLSDDAIEEIDRATFGGSNAYRNTKEDFINISEASKTTTTTPDKQTQVLEGKVEVLKSNQNARLEEYSIAKEKMAQMEKDGSITSAAEREQYRQTIDSYENNQTLLNEMESKIASGEKITSSDIERIEDATTFDDYEESLITSISSSKEQLVAQGKVEALKANVESSLVQYEDAKLGLDSIESQLKNKALSVDERDELLLKKIQYQNTITNYENNKEVLSEMEAKLASGIELSDSDLSKIDSTASFNPNISLSDNAVSESSAASNVITGKIEVLKSNLNASLEAYYSARSRIDDIQKELSNPGLTEEEKEDLLLQKIQYQNTVDNYEHNAEVLAILENKIATEEIDAIYDEANEMFNGLNTFSANTLTNYDFDINEYLDNYYEFLIDSNYDSKSYELLNSINSSISLFDSLFDSQMNLMMGSAFEVNKLIYQYVLESQKDIYTYVMNSLTPAMSEVQKLSIILEGRAELQKRLEVLNEELEEHISNKPSQMYETYTGSDGKEHKRRTSAYNTWDNNKIAMEEEIEDVEKQIEDFNEEARIILLKIGECDEQTINFGTYMFA